MPHLSFSNLLLFSRERVFYFDYFLFYFTQKYVLVWTLLVKLMLPIISPITKNLWLYFTNTCLLFVGLLPLFAYVWLLIWVDLFLSFLLGDFSITITFYLLPWLDYSHNSYLESINMGCFRTPNPNNINRYVNLMSRRYRITISVKQYCNYTYKKKIIYYLPDIAAMLLWLAVFTLHIIVYLIIAEAIIIYLPLWCMGYILVIWLVQKIRLICDTALSLLFCILLKVWLFMC